MGCGLIAFEGCQQQQVSNLSPQAGCQTHAEHPVSTVITPDRYPILLLYSSEPDCRNKSITSALFSATLAPL